MGAGIIARFGAPQERGIAGTRGDGGGGSGVGEILEVGEKGGDGSLFDLLE